MIVNTLILRIVFNQKILSHMHSRLIFYTESNSMNPDQTVSKETVSLGNSLILIKLIEI